MTYSYSKDYLKTKTDNEIVTMYHNTLSDLRKCYTTKDNQLIYSLKSELHGRKITI
jgi:hypothetical protein